MGSIPTNPWRPDQEPFYTIWAKMNYLHIQWESYGGDVYVLQSQKLGTIHEIKDMSLEQIAARYDELRRQ
jgi:hypothetical protein